MERHSPLVDAELHGSCVRICTLMALERRPPPTAVAYTRAHGY